jgi:hypothetical protein
MKRLVAPTLLAIVLASACAPLRAQPVTLMSAEVPRKQIRRDHAGLASRLDEAEGMLAALSASHDPPERTRLMHGLVVLFTVDVDEQAGWEERELFDLFDARVTAPFREDHARMRRLVGELVAIRDSDVPDVAAFVLRSYRLVALTRDHIAREDAALGR